MPSQTGATVFIITSRSVLPGMNGKRMPMPRSKPSMTTYIMMPKMMITAQISGRSIPMIQISLVRLWPASA
ncbi:hypothetical protein D3C86_1398680 [compost metagenome]